jgi:hypothetical protein
VSAVVAGVQLKWLRDGLGGGGGGGGGVRESESEREFVKNETP